MIRAVGLVVALLGACLIATWASLPPPPRPASAPAAQFSAERAMADVRVTARAPHPTGSAEAVRVREHLTARLRALGLETTIQSAPLGARAQERLRRWGAGGASQLANVVGRLPGRDPSLPSVALLAHYDSVAGSPGAADDGAGVAAILEVLRALRSAGQPLRDVVVVFTDAEELDLDGAGAFFASHPLASRVGVVINLEARGGGGRALMFETGAGNGAMSGLYAAEVRRPSAQSVAVLIYRLMPNSSDFTLAKEKGLPGFNFAFMGGADQYHSPTSTPDRLSRGSLQHIGEQALQLTAALARRPALPPKAPDAVFADVLGQVVLIHPAWGGWVLLAVCGGLWALAATSTKSSLTALAVGAGQGAAHAAALLLHAVIALDLFNRVSGAGPGANYFDRLAALPRLELQAAAVGLACFVGVGLLRGAGRRRLAAAPALLLAGLDVVLGAAPLILGVMGVAAAALASVGVRREPRPMPEWLGVLLLMLVAGVAVQVAAPTAAPLAVWPVAAACLAAALASRLDATLASGRAVALVAAVAAVAGAQVLAMAHFAFLGVGADLAAAMAVFVLLTATLAWPLAPGRPSRAAGAILVMALLVAGGVALSVRLDPLSPSVPVWAR